MHIPHSPAIPIRLPRIFSPFVTSAYSSVHDVGYRAEIDGLRAVAVLAVILFHADFPFSGGFVGVDVFFVISGYLITKIILNEKYHASFSVVQFYERRIRRILPALFVVMLACLLPAWFWMLPEQLVSFSRSLMAVSIFASNFFFWANTGYFDGAANERPLLHTWSLGIEEQFYLLFPLLLLIVWPLGRRRIFAVVCGVTAASLLVSEYGARNYPSATFFLAPTRAWELLMGSLLAILPLRIVREHVNDNFREVFSALGIALIVAAILFFHEDMQFPGFAALIPAGGAALIVAFARPGTVVGGLLSRKIVVGIGLISYSAYLWHQPLFAFARVYALNGLSVAASLGLIVVTFALAYLTWRYVEQPCRNRHRFSRKQVFAFAAAGSFMFMAIGWLGSRGSGFEQRFSADAREALKYAKQDPELSVCSWKLVNNPSPQAACRIGNRYEQPSVVIWGDSHARSLVKAVDSELSARNVAGLNLTVSDCPPLLYVESLRRASTTRACEQLRHAVYNEILHNDSIQTVIVAARWAAIIEGRPFDNGEGGIEHSRNDRWMVPDSEVAQPLAVASAIRQTLARIAATGKRVIVVYPIPEVGWNVPEYVVRASQRGLLDQAPHTSFERFKSRNQLANETLDATSAYPNVVRIRTSDLFCDIKEKNRCVTQLGGQLLYSDDDHLSIVGARMVVDRVAPHLPRVIGGGAMEQVK